MRLAIPDASLQAAHFTKRKWVLVADSQRAMLLSIPHHMHYVEVEDDMFASSANNSQPTLEAWSDWSEFDQQKDGSIQQMCHLLNERYFAFDVVCILASGEMLEFIRQLLPSSVLAKARFGIPKAPARPSPTEMRQQFESLAG